MASKRFNSDLVGPPVKKSKILDEESEGDEQEFTINEEYARRFEHNKKRIDLQRLEEKYGKGARREEDGDESEEESDSEDDEDEDDIGELVTEDLDADIAETLNAIRNKDPRVYDANVKFFKEVETPANGNAPAPKENSMTLKDYHRINLLNGASNGDNDDQEPKSYIQEQDDVKKELRKALRRTADESDEEDVLFKAKSKPTEEALSKAPPLDPTLADREPETYLSNFFAAKAWIPAVDSRFAHLESDDEEEDARADQFETAYNLRFEDPDVSNKTLVSHARDAVEAFSVRREEKSGRARARELKRQKKDEEKAERDAEKARLRKLQIEKMEEKVEMIRKAAGGKDINVADWTNVLEDDFDDSKFDGEMRKRFDEDYYQAQEAQDSSADEDGSSKTRKVKKPKWDDDIDIKDLIPDFKSSGSEAPALSDDDDSEASDREEIPTTANKKSLKQQRAEQKSQARRDRRIIETLVDQSLLTNTSTSKQKGPTFRYRETSPTNFGLEPLDILAAEDRQLNEFVGLKKLAAFRDAEKKAKDRRKLGKKARLREWRKETFGKKEGPGVEDWFLDGVGADEGVDEGKEGGNVKDGERKKRRKRSKNKKDKQSFEV